MQWNNVTNITTHLKLKPTKIDTKLNLETIINIIQNNGSIQRNNLVNFHSKSSLKFNSVTKLSIKKDILSLPSKKVTREGDIFQPRYWKTKKWFNTNDQEWPICHQGNNHNLRNFQALKSSHNRTVKFGTETISYRGSQIWNLIPERLRALKTLKKF